MGWIINQKRYRSGHFLGSILVLTAEVSLLSICLLLFLVVAKSRETDWFKLSVEQQVATDAFSGISDRNIFIALSIAVVFVVVFVFISLCIFRRLQLEPMQRNLGMFLTCGYTIKQMEIFLAIDVGIDILVAAPFSVTLSLKAIEILQRKEEFLVMFSGVGTTGTIFGVVMLFGMLGIYVTVIWYEKLWLNHVIRRGMTCMLRYHG